MAGLEDAMNGATLIHLMTSLAPRAERPRRGPRTNLRGGVVLMLVWAVLAGTFLYDIARRPPGAGARESAATTLPGALALTWPSPPPRSP